MRENRFAPFDWFALVVHSIWKYTLQITTRNKLTMEYDKHATIGDFERWSKPFLAWADFWGRGVTIEVILCALYHLFLNFSFANLYYLARGAAAKDWIKVQVLTTPQSSYCNKAELLWVTSPPGIRYELPLSINSCSSEQNASDGPVKLKVATDGLTPEWIPDKRNKGLSRRIKWRRADPRAPLYPLLSPYRIRTKQKNGNNEF